MHDVWRKTVSNKIHQSISCGHIPLFSGFIIDSFNVATARPDGDHEDDAKDDRKDGCRKVEDDSSEPNFSGEG